MGSRENIFVNFTNHSSEMWEEKQLYAACSERKTVQSGNVKSSIFEFVGFREYVYREQGGKT